MINEKKKIMETKIKINQINNTDKSNKFYENLMIFYDNILRQTTDNIWWTSVSLILQYLHLIFFGLNKNVS